ncbi:MAG: virulence RhuM family protein [Anaerolineaceae bacterium]|nr:virulence RhuM family protein [Anaerolineaceae bacterium]
MTNQENRSELLMFQTEDGSTRINVILDSETVWLSQKLIAELYQRNVPTINEHIKNIYTEGELEQGATIRNFRIVQQEGGREVSRMVEYYNLDMILSVGYRVRSHRGTQFRKWATTQLTEFLIKGFVMDDERLKDGRGYDYFDELLERIRDIRASEKRFYQKVKDIYTTAVDYDPHTEMAKNFFAAVQNKMHWAIHGHTAAELITDRADANKPNMGLTSWKGAKVRKGDISIAKNYLTGDEIRSLNRIVTMYLDYAEEQAERRRAMTMQDWADRLDAFLRFNEREVLRDAGKVSAEVAKKLAEDEYEQLNKQRLLSEARQADDEIEQLGRWLEGQPKDE